MECVSANWLDIILLFRQILEILKQYTRIPNYNIICEHAQYNSVIYDNEIIIHEKYA